MFLLFILAFQGTPMDQFQLVQDMAVHIHAVLKEKRLKVVVLEPFSMDGKVNGLTGFLDDLLLAELRKSKARIRFLLTENHPKYRKKIKATMKGSVALTDDLGLFTVHFRITTPNGRLLKAISGQFRLTEEHQHLLEQMTDSEEWPKCILANPHGNHHPDWCITTPSSHPKMFHAIDGRHPGMEDPELHFEGRHSVLGMAKPV